MRSEVIGKGNGRYVVGIRLISRFRCRQPHDGHLDTMERKRLIGRKDTGLTALIVQVGTDLAFLSIPHVSLFSC